MPLRPATPWRWALQKRTNTPTEAVWVTDEILSRTFQRFLDLSTTTIKRPHSSVPGPIHHRSRLGKRTMTELNQFQRHGALPPPRVPDARDLPNCYWQPPTPRIWVPPPEPPEPSEPTRATVEPPEPEEVALPTEVDLEVQPTHATVEETHATVEETHETVEPPPEPGEVIMEQAALPTVIDFEVQPTYAIVELPEPKEAVLELVVLPTIIDFEIQPTDVIVESTHTAVGPTSATAEPTHATVEPAHTTVEPVHTTFELLEPEGVALEPVVLPTVIDFKAQPYREWLVQLVDMHNEEYDSVDDFRSRFKTYVRRFKKAVSKGKLTGTAVAEIYSVASQQLQTIAQRDYHWKRKYLRCRDVYKLKQLQLYLMDATCSGIRSANERDRTFCITTPYFWEHMLAQLAYIPVTVNSARVLTFILKSLKPRSLVRGAELVATALNEIFILWKGARTRGDPEYWDQAEISSTNGMASMWSARVDELLDMIRSDIANHQPEAARFKLKTAERCIHRVRRFTMKAAHLMSDDQQITDVLAEGLQHWKPERYGVLFAKATLLLGKPKIHWTRSHYNWLHVMVRMKYVRKKVLTRLLDFFAPRGHAALSHTELGQLLLLHWRTQEKLQDMGWTLRLWRTMRNEKKFGVLATLALAINRSNSPLACTVLFRELWSFLAHRGAKVTLIKQVSQLSTQHALSRGFLKRLAWSSNDPRVALLFHDIVEKQRGTVQQFWWPQFWDKFAIMLCQKKYKKMRIDPIRIAHGLLGSKAERRSREWMEQHPDEAHLLQQPVSKGLEQDYYKKLDVVESEPMDQQLLAYHPQGYGEQRKKGQQQIRRLKMALHLLVTSRTLTDSQALRQVSIFTSALATKQGYLSARDLSTLSTVIMRLLGHGKMGATVRLKHYLGLVYTHLGRDVCSEVGMILKRRRDANSQPWQDTTKRAQEKEKIRLEARRSYVLWRSYVGRNSAVLRRLSIHVRKARRSEQTSSSLLRTALDHESEMREEQEQARARRLRLGTAIGRPPIRNGRLKRPKRRQANDDGGHVSGKDQFAHLLADHGEEQVTSQATSF